MTRASVTSRDLLSLCSCGHEVVSVCFYGLLPDSVKDWLPYVMSASSAVLSGPQHRCTVLGGPSTVKIIWARGTLACKLCVGLRCVRTRGNGAALAPTDGASAATLVAYAPVHVLSSPMPITPPLPVP